MAGLAAGGVAAVQLRTVYKRPYDSRLVLACETMADAIAWKVAIEHQLQLLEQRPVLPTCADPLVIQVRLIYPILSLYPLIFSGI